MDPITGAIISGGLNILSGMSNNAKIQKNATAIYNADKLFIERDQGIAQEGLDYNAQELQQQIGMALTDVVYTGLKTEGVVRAKRAETGTYGNTAARQEAVMAMREEMAKDKIIQQGESSMVDLQTKMRQLKYETEDRHRQNLMAYNDRISQKQSTFDMIAGGISAGISGYSQGLSMDSAATALESQKTVLEMQKIQLDLLKGGV